MASSRPKRLQEIMSSYSAIPVMRADKVRARTFKQRIVDHEVLPESPDLAFDLPPLFTLGYLFGELVPSFQVPRAQAPTA